MRISSRGNVSMGCAGWLVSGIVFAGVACLVVAWPLALANSNGHIAWWGWVLEGAWLFGAALAVGVGNARRRKAAQA